MTQGVVDVVCDPKRGRGEDGSLADRLFFFSVHLFDSCRDCVEQPDLYATLEGGDVPHSSAAARRRPEAAQEDEWEFYPGTGAHDDVTKMVCTSYAQFCGLPVGVTTIACDATSMPGYKRTTGTTLEEAEGPKPEGPKPEAHPQEVSEGCGGTSSCG
jgi:hypothetical protein|eukprot:COSAG02_NODE_510_length_20863_cov_139.455233_12_plen_157_part_00